jgi:hypothetical protein
MKDDATFWLAFCCIVLLIPLLIVSFDKVVSLIYILCVYLSLLFLTCSFSREKAEHHYSYHWNLCLYNNGERIEVFSILQLNSLLLLLLRTSL